jgi:hypothetical protein
MDTSGSTEGTAGTRSSGSSIKTRFEIQGRRKPTLFRLPKINFVDDKTGKPIGINRHQPPTDRRYGNSDSDPSKCCNGRRFQHRWRPVPA